MPSSRAFRLLFDFLLQHLLGLVHFGRKVGATPAIGVVQQHELAVLLAQKLLGDAAFAVSQSAPVHVDSPILGICSNIVCFLCGI